MEKWNAYTKDGELTNIELVRGNPIPDGLYHLVCEVLVKHNDGSFLCMKRSGLKSFYPGYYEATAGGSALKGENMLQCIRRELKEETGIDCSRFDEVGCQIFDDDHCIFYSFVCDVNCDKNSITLQDGETEGYKWLDKQEFVEFVNSDKMIPSQKRRYSNYFFQNNILGGLNNGKWNRRARYPRSFTSRGFARRCLSHSNR